MVLAAILDILVKMMVKHKTDVRILVVDLVEKVYLYLILAALVQKLFFQNDVSMTSAAILDFAP